MNRPSLARRLNFFELALDLNISVDNEPGIAKNYNSLGKTWLALGNDAQAQTVLSAGLRPGAKDRRKSHGLPVGLQSRGNLPQSETKPILPEA
jgi:hypothetical protein